MKEFRVKTKIGTLVAREAGDYDYPAIEILFDNGVEEILLSTTEVDQNNKEALLKSDKEPLLRSFLYTDKECDEPTEEVRFGKDFYTKSYSIDLETLFQSIEKEKGSSSFEDETFVDLAYGKIRKTIDSNTEYYDFVDKFGEIPCVTGETCIVLGVTENFVSLMEENEKNPL